MNPPDSQQVTDAAKAAHENLSWWQLFLSGGSGVVLVRAVVSYFRRLGVSDRLVSVGASERETLLAEAAAARKQLVEQQEHYEARIAALEKARDERIQEVREALYEAENANIDARGRIAMLEAQLQAKSTPAPEALPTVKSYRSPKRGD